MLFQGDYILLLFLEAVTFAKYIDYTNHADSGYPSKMSKIWTFVAPAGKSFKVTFTTFSLEDEYESTCDDWLQVCIHGVYLERCPILSGRLQIPVLWHGI